MPATLRRQLGVEHVVLRVLTMIPMYTDPANIHVQSPRTAFGEISEI